MIIKILCVIALQSGELQKHDLHTTDILDAMQACEVKSASTNNVGREWLEFINESDK